MNIIISLLVIFGGLGFTAIIELYEYLIGKRRKISVNSKFSTLITLLLLGVGTFLFFIFRIPLYRGANGWECSAASFGKFFPFGVPTHGGVQHGIFSRYLRGYSIVVHATDVHRCFAQLHREWYQDNNLWDSLSWGTHLPTEQAVYRIL